MSASKTLNNNDDPNHNNDEDSGDFVCLVCFIHFYSKLELTKHLTKIHRLTNMCRICYFDMEKIERFANPVSLRNHNLKCHSDKMVKCVCGSMLINRKMLMSHLKKFKCDASNNEPNKSKMVKCVCGKRFSSQEQIMHHQSKCRKRWDDDLLLNDLGTSRRHSNRKSRGKTRMELSTGDRSLVEISQNLNTDVYSSYSSTEYRRRAYNRKCKSNIPNDADQIDEVFRKAIVSSLYDQAPMAGNSYLNSRFSKTRSQLDNHRTSTVTMATSINQTFRQRKNSNSSRFVPPLSSMLDANNNMPCELSAATSYATNTKSVTNINHRGTNKRKHNSFNTGYSDDLDNNNYVAQTNDNNCNSSFVQTNDNIEFGRTRPLRKPGKPILKYDRIKEIARNHSRKQVRHIKVRSYRKRRYACQFCGKLYMKLYMQFHENVVHNGIKWMIVPMPATPSKPDGIYKFHCRWCHFVSVHWNVAVQHHYTHHEDRELDILCLTSTCSTTIHQHHVHTTSTCSSTT